MGEDEITLDFFEKNKYVADAGSSDHPVYIE